MSTLERYTRVILGAMRATAAVHSASGTIQTVWKLWVSLCATTMGCFHEVFSFNTKFCGNFTRYAASLRGAVEASTAHQFARQASGQKTKVAEAW